MTAAQRHDLRRAQSAPLLDKLYIWLQESQTTVAPKTPLGKAVTYALNQWSTLTRYLDDGRLSMDNNRAERAIKPFVMGRKAWLFANTRQGARASAILYSLIETAKANNWVPVDYLTHLFTALPTFKEGDDLTPLFPWNVTLSAEPV
jgi:hypothetical protein